MRSLLSYIAEIPYRLSRTILILSLILACIAIASFGSVYGPAVAIMAVACALALIFKRVRGALNACGTARWATEEDVRRKRMLDGRPGLIIGKMFDNRPVTLAAGIKALLDWRLKSSVACRQFFRSIRPQMAGPAPLVRLSDAVHTAVFAPTGVGKGVSIVIPFLKDCPESCVATDFKGELVNETAEYRRRKFKHRIIKLDPMRLVTQTPDTFNPLDFIDKDSPTALDDCRALAETLVIRTGEEKDPHFIDSAELVTSAAIATVVQYADPDDRSLQTVRDLVNDPAKFEAMIKLLCGSDAWGGMLARQGHQLTHYKDKELASVLTTANRFLKFLDTPAIAENTRKSSFDPAELRNGKMTIYFVLPVEYVRTQSPLMRMWFVGMLNAVVRGGLQEKNKVHFVLDESATIGHLESLDDAVDKFRGHGVRLKFFYQSIGQLKKCFPNGQDQTLLSNVSQIFFGVNDQPTADYVSQRLGEETIVVASGGKNWGTSSQDGEHHQKSRSRSQNGSDNWQQAGRKLLRPEELTGLSPRYAITFTPGVPPICTTLVPYYERNWPVLKGLHRAVGTLVLSAAVFVVASMLAVAPPRRTPPRARPAVTTPPWSINERKGAS